MRHVFTEIFQKLKLKIKSFSRCFNRCIFKHSTEVSSKVCSLLEHSCAILISFKTVVIFNIISADFVLMSADVVLKMTTILKEMRIAQLCSKSERTLNTSFLGRKLANFEFPNLKLHNQYCHIWIRRGQRHCKVPCKYLNILCSHASVSNYLVVFG